MTELKPCPFCGGEAEYIWNAYYGYEYVACSKCNARTRDHYEDNGYETYSAITTWNKRFNEDTDREIIQAMLDSKLLEGYSLDDIQRAVNKYSEENNL